MARSLNPKAAAASLAQAAVPTPPTPPLPDPPLADHMPVVPPRRNLLVGMLAGFLGLVAGAFPALAGLPVILNPLRKKPGAGQGESALPSIRVATVDSLPADGRPVAVPVLADKVDAWTREANQPIGAVFLRKVDGKVECFNAICPHAGCMVAFSADRHVFQCPCHTSSFGLDGKRMMPSPSPRDMDQLQVDAEKLKQGEVWVEFVNYYPGKANQEAKG